jgi:hypothetical protein
VKPVIGCDVWITNETERDKPSRRKTQGA